MRYTLVAAIAGGALLLIGCTSGGSERTDTAAAPVTTVTSAPPPAPASASYELVENGDELTMLVTTDDTGELGAAFRELAGTVFDTYPDGGYFVRIDCALDDQSTRLGNGRIAVGQMGAAQTGLPAGKRDIDWSAGQTCQPGYVAPAFDPDRVLDEVYALELCRGKVEDEYVADQRPVELTGTKVAETDGSWTVTGVSRGNDGSAVAVEYRCTAHVNDAGTLMVDLPRFEVI